VKKKRKKIFKRKGILFFPHKLTQNPTNAKLGFMPLKPIMSFSQLVHWWVLAGSLWLFKSG
jgi:hypothetical protein